MTTKVLMVEDHADTSQVVSLLLGIEGIAVVTARDGYEGIEKAQAERPGLIIADLELPELDGIEMIRRLRKRPELAGIPIIAFTAHGNRLAGEAIEAGADGVLVKTTHFDKLIKTVKALLNPDND